MEASPATRKALDHLWSTQRGDGPEAGSWDWLDFGLEPWEAGDGRVFGATLAARAVGTARGYDLKSAEVRPRVEKLRTYLRGRFAGREPVQPPRDPPRLSGPATGSSPSRSGRS